MSRRLAGTTAVLAFVRARLVDLLFLSFCGFFLLPVQTGVPGLSTFTLTKAVALLLAGTAALERLAGGRRAPGAPPVAFRPLLALAVWPPVAALFRPEFRALDVKLLLGPVLGAVAGWAALATLAEPAARTRAVRLVLWGGSAAVVFALVEPWTPPQVDAFWRWFRPYLDVSHPLLGGPTAARGLHWDRDGIFRVSGIFSNPNELANFLSVWFPLLAAALAASRASGWRAAAPWAGAVAAAWALAGTMTRSSILGSGLAAALAVTALAMGGLARLRRGERRARLARPAARVALAAAAGAVAAGTVWIWIHRMTAFSACVAGLIALALAALGAKAVAARGARRDAVPSWFASRAALLGALLLAVPALRWGGAAAPDAPPSRWLPELRQPDSPAGRLAESAVHAAWERQKLWRVALWLLPDAPLTGPGYHVYAFVIHRHPAVKARFDLDADRGDIDRGVDNPHNLYLTAATASGLVGLGLLLHVLLVLLRAGLAVAVSARRPAKERALAGAMLWHWIAFAGTGLVGRNVYPVNDAVAFFALAALTLAPLGRPPARA